MLLISVILYCLIKKKVVRCCVKDSPTHLEQGASGYIANFQHQLGPQPSAPTALQFQPHQATSLADIEHSLARMQLQLSSQKEQLENNKNSGTSGSSHGGPRNQYPLV